ncbi:XAC2610-related protein [Oceanivirga salmonicida]|uniref:XAC2610-related protein n=1 Tax=Oceanivirga salmonicida TaxID=1769291 RepID=UPI0012E19B02|nr:hypothetical protein [Oceanivirga salmonicida]
MKKILIYLIMSMPLFSKPVTKIYDYSDKYKVSITAEKNEKDLNIGLTVIIIDKKTKTEVLKSESTLDFEMTEDDNSFLIDDLTDDNFEYEIINQDFNFDGKKDFAIIKNYGGYKGSPLHDIYLDTDKGFKYSREFSELVYESGRLFEVDYDKKLIYTFDSSGIFERFYATFRVVDNKPIKIESIVQKIIGQYAIVDYVIENKKVGNKWINKEYIIWNWNIIDKSDLKNLYKLKFKNGKEMNLYKYENSLIYAFENKDIIELYYDENFYYDKDKKTLSFTNNNIKYEIYNDGITVRKGKNKLYIKAIRKNDKDLNIDLNIENVYKK